MPALVGQEDPGMDTGSPAAQPDNLAPLAQEVESHEPLTHEVEVSAPLAQEVELHEPPEQEMEQHEPLKQDMKLHTPPDHAVELQEGRSLLFSDTFHRDLEPAQTTREEENASYEEDTEGDRIELLAALAAVSPTKLGYHLMDGDLPENTVVEEDVPICHQFVLDRTVPAPAEMGEVRDEDNIVLRESSHHSRGPTQSSVTPTTSGSHSSYTTPLPWTTPTHNFHYGSWLSIQSARTPRGN